MIGFEYKYTTSSEIIDNIKTLSEYSIIEISILIFFIGFYFLLLLYIIPYSNILIKNIEKKKKTEKRKKMIEQIAMQKDIDDEIEKELNINH